MQNRTGIVVSALSAWLLWMLATTGVPAQEQERPPDRPKVKQDGSPKVLHPPGPKDKPPSKEPLAKPPRGPWSGDVSGMPGGFHGMMGDPSTPPPLGGPWAGPPTPKPGAAMPGVAGMPGFDPEMHQLDREEHELARKTGESALKYRHAIGDQREQIRKELTDLVIGHFEVRQQRRELQLKRLEEELARLRESIQGRNEARDQIVNRRIAELLGDEDDLSF